MLPPLPGEVVAEAAALLTEVGADAALAAADHDDAGSMAAAPEAAAAGVRP